MRGGPGLAGRTQRGSGWVEFAIVAALLTGLAAVFLPRLLDYQERAEKTLVDVTLRNLRTALRWQVAQRMIHGNTDDLAPLEDANPVPWLERPPAGYAGEFSGEPPELADGSWYFDTATRNLVYLPRRSSHLTASSVGPPRLSWQVMRLKRTQGADVKAPVDALVIAEAMPYQWF